MNNFFYKTGVYRSRVKYCSGDATGWINGTMAQV
jgi:hypothetical protein